MIKGKTVSLRALELEDLKQAKEWRNLEEFRKHFREHRELNSVHQENWFQRMNQSQTDYMFGIIENKTKALIGVCGLIYVNWINRSADYSFYIGKDQAYIDQSGLAEEASQLLIRYGFQELNLNKIWMELYEFDQAKISFFQEKFKFKKDGTLRQNAFKEGRYWDSIIISLLQSEFASKK